MENKVVRGRDLMLFKKVSENYVALGAATTHTMNLSREELDISNKDTGEYGDTELGQISWDIQADSMMILYFISVNNTLVLSKRHSSD